MRCSRLVSTLTCALLLAGCGGSAKEQSAYTEKVDAAQERYVRDFEQVTRKLTPTSTAKQDRETLRAFGTATGTFVTALKEITPPAEVKEQHAKLVTVLADYQRRVSDAAADLGKGTEADRAKVRTDLSSSVADTQSRIAEAIGAINTALAD